MGTGVAVVVGVTVGVGVAVRVGVGVRVAVAVTVGVAVGTGVAVATNGKPVRSQATVSNSRVDRNATTFRLAFTVFSFSQSAVPAP